MAKQGLEKIRNIADYYERLLSDMVAMHDDVRKLETTNNAQAAKRLRASLRKLRNNKKGNLTLFYNRTKEVQEDIRKIANQ